MSKKKNILFILSDQHRRESTGCYGHPQMQTPNMDRMAAQGMKFNQCWSTSPVCSPFRATLQTGLYPHQHGMVHNNFYLDQRLPSLADWMHQAGYRTSYIGKSHWWGPAKPGYVDPQGRLRWETFQGHNRGHFHYDAPLFDKAGQLTHEAKGEYDATHYTNLAIEQMQVNDDRPWCIQLNLGQPHTETPNADYEGEENLKRLNAIAKELGFTRYLESGHNPGEPNFPQHLVGPHVPEAFVDLYPANSIELPPSVATIDENVARYMLQDYYAMISSIDHEIGRLLDHLKATGEDKNTIVIYTSDHGDFVGSHEIGRSKAKPYQCAARTPLLVWGAGIKAGGETNAPVTTVDLLPTLVDLIGLLPQKTGGEWTYAHQTVHDREIALSDSPMQPDGMFLRGESFKSWIETGEGNTQEDLLLALGNWRALFDGQWLYAIRKDEDGVKPWHLIDTLNDPYDMHDLVEQEAGRMRVMHKRLAERLHLESDDFLKAG